MALCEICDGEFPRKNSSTYCSVACANAARVIHAETRCERCGVTFKPRSASNRFCSPACYREATRPEVPMRRCDYCDGEFRPRSGQRLCSRRCAGLAVLAENTVEVDATCEICGSAWTWRGPRWCSPSRWCSPTCWNAAHPPPERDCAWCGRPSGFSVHCSPPCRRASASKPLAIAYRTCPTCHRLFVTRATAQRVFCGRACHKIAPRPKRPPRPGPPCERCGSPTMPRNASRRFCSTACQRGAVQRTLPAILAEQSTPWPRLALRVPWSPEPLVVDCPPTVGGLPSALATALRDSASASGVELSRHSVAGILKVVLAA